jgi:hypothetical protein
MRPRGRSRVSRSFPVALAICDRCGFRYNHSDLSWQFDWQGPRMANIRRLVCQSCLDAPFEHNRTILIPADPIAIANPRPEFYVPDDNPISPNSADPLGAIPGTVLAGANLGNMIGGGGLDAPYFGPLSKPAVYSALLNPSSTSTTANWIGKNWSALPGLMPTVLPTVMSGQMTSLRYAVAGFTAIAPADQSFLGSSATSLTFSGWDGSVWHQLWKGASVGSNGETITVTSSQLTDTNPYYVHALSVWGDQTPAAIASLQINANAEGVLSSPAAAATAPVVSS